MGFEDLEPLVCDLIHTTDLTSRRVENSIGEIRKEFTEFKIYIEKLTATQDTTILTPIKAIINEQSTQMYSFINELKLDIKQ